MNPEFDLKGKILEDKARARRAQEALDLFLADFIAARKATIYDAFLAVHPTNTEELTRLKFAHAAVADLELEVQSVIDSGTKLLPPEPDDFKQPDEGTTDE
jgi:hypothetical protein